ncbi:hypothetical protein IMZ31_19565 (plasmid) [Pontibacillus sp. ALD_SL1]|uniref:hypothetical protein n=1 Tax=Pontibacillus sp. ALD_SL1 TaxID=2777185 RepID=UPI001A96662C|nr:hypothetical protein [Pontibacillus sp. ALD_SL1]QST02750.1 hypothetical protein IMZ31_19565 [Pontibacillus sp. ALD_SL1]
MKKTVGVMRISGEEALSKREEKLLQSLLLHVFTLSCAPMVGMDMMFVPVKRNVGEYFHYEVTWNEIVDQEALPRLKNETEARFHHILQLAELKDCTVGMTFRDSYQH